MRHDELHEFGSEPIADAHLHHTQKLTPQRSVEVLSDAAAHFNLSRVLLAAITYYTPLENLLSFYCKARLSPIAYTASGLIHHRDGRDTAEHYGAEIRRYHAMGCDGIKLIEGKPNVHRSLREPNLAASAYDLMFSYAEEEGIPILAHIGDPAYFWDVTKMDAYAIEHGWYNPPGSATLEEIRAGIEGVLAKFPQLRLTLAHFYFMGDDLDRAARLLDRYPNLMLDLTPAPDVFISLSENIEGARAFFRHYTDRLIFGTDSYNFDVPRDAQERANGLRQRLVRSFLEGEAPFSYTHHTLQPLRLGREVSDPILRTAFVRRYGEVPRALDRERILDECRRVEETFPLSEWESEGLAEIRRYFTEEYEQA